MSKLVILNNSVGEVIIASVSKEQENILEEKYDDNIEEWLSEEGIEEKLGINMSNCNYMWMGEGQSIREIEIYHI